MITGAFDNNKGAPPPRLFGWIFIYVAVAMIVLGLTYACCLAIAGRFLKQRRGYVFCMVVAALSCVHAPLGTVLGVFTLVVLLRPGVKELFGRRERFELEN